MELYPHVLFNVPVFLLRNQRGSATQDEINFKILLIKVCFDLLALLLSRTQAINMIKRGMTSLKKCYQL